MAEKISIFSPLPGVFYLRPNPEADLYVQEGQKVKIGETIGLVEVMKNFYEIKAEQNGVIEKILVENEEVINAGQEVAVLITEE
jgi:acetyl-CoA carboxylase biotin carboxyl carrier protein